MTEKRFTTDNGSNEDVTLVDNLTGKEYEDNFWDVVDLMNNLDEENFQLKRIIRKYCPPYVWRHVKLGDLK